MSLSLDWKIGRTPDSSPSVVWACLHDPNGDKHAERERARSSFFLSLRPFHASNIERKKGNSQPAGRTSFSKKNRRNGEEGEGERMESFVGENGAGVWRLIHLVSFCGLFGSIMEVPNSMLHVIASTFLFSFRFPISDQSYTRSHSEA